ncbi:hypothetical protein GBAR_LOCUS18875, partial [Geodia barretti]
MSEDVYFMPCLLQVVAWEVVEEHRVSGGKALALHFPDSGPLMGTFCSTVAYLLSPENSHPCPWRVVQNEVGAPECLHRNVIKFTIPKCTGTVSLIDHFTHFELHLCTHPKKAAQLWKLAHDAVFAGLKKAGKTIGYTNNTPVPAIVCPAHPRPAKPHPATVDKDRVWTCSVNSGKFGDIDEDSIPWLTLCTSASAESATSSPSSSSSAVPPTSQPPLSVSTASASSTTDTTTTNTPVPECFIVSYPIASVPSLSLYSSTTIAPVGQSVSTTASVSTAPHPVSSCPVIEYSYTSSTIATAAIPLSSTASTTHGGGVCRPTLPELLRLEIPEGIATSYTTFGIFLLNDETGDQVDIIE